MFEMINVFSQTAIGASVILVGVPAIAGLAIKVVYDKYAAWDEADRTARKAKRNIIRRRNGQEPLA